MKQLTAEEFLREKLESEIQAFGDGTTEFHTRDIEHLLKCLDQKDERIKHTEMQCADLIGKINWSTKQQFEELLAWVMSIDNRSAEERLRDIRNIYKQVWNEIKSAEAKKV